MTFWNEPLPSGVGLHSRFFAQRPLKCLIPQGVRPGHTAKDTNTCPAAGFVLLREPERCFANKRNREAGSLEILCDGKGFICDRGRAKITTRCTDPVRIDTRNRGPGGPPRSDKVSARVASSIYAIFEINVTYGKEDFWRCRTYEPRKTNLYRTLHPSNITPEGTRFATSPSARIRIGLPATSEVVAFPISQYAFDAELVVS